MPKKSPAASIFAIAIIAAFVAGCSSTDTRTSAPGVDFDGDYGFDNPGIEAENPIEEDIGYKVVDSDIYLDGEFVGTIEGGVDGQGPKAVTNENGEHIATVQNQYNGYWTVYLVDPNNPHAGGGDNYWVKVDGGKFTIDWANSVIDGRWGVEPPPEVKAQAARLNKDRLRTVKSHIQARRR